jgi:hypothetical protein
MFKRHWLLASSGSAVAAAVDCSVGWEALPNPIYFVPIAVFAWRTDRRMALHVAALASVAFALVRWLSAGSHSSSSMLPYIALQLASCVGVALAVDGLRRLAALSRRTRECSLLDTQVGHARAIMRSIDCKGTPRPRGNLEKR